MAPDGVTGSESRLFRPVSIDPGSGPELLLQVTRRMADAARARGDGVPSYETLRWLGTLARCPAFADPDRGVPHPDALGRALAALLARAGSGPVADLVLAALRCLPVAAGDAADAGEGEQAADAGGGAGLPGAFLTALVLLLGPEPPTGPEVERLLDRLEAAEATLDRRGSEGLGLRFLVLATELAIGVRSGLPVPLLARQLHDLGSLAWRGAAAMALPLDAAEERAERLHAALGDPLVAMRAHARVPRRALASGEAGAVRKEFALADALADGTRGTLEAAEERVAALRGEIAALQALGRLLQEEAGLVLLAPQRG